jgi:hypothetical protein
MSTRQKSVWAKVALVLLTLGAMYSVYWLLFSLWMTSYPFANLKTSWSRLYLWLIISIIVGAFWSALAVWLFRQKTRNGEFNQR